MFWALEHFTFSLTHSVTAVVMLKKIGQVFNGFSIKTDCSSFTFLNIPQIDNVLLSVLPPFLPSFLLHHSLLHPTLLPFLPFTFLLHLCFPYTLSHSPLSLLPFLPTLSLPNPFLPASLFPTLPSSLTLSLSPFYLSNSSPTTSLSAVIIFLSTDTQLSTMQRPRRSSLWCV